MTEPNPNPDFTPAQTPPGQPSPVTGATPRGPAKKRRHWILKSILLLVACVLILIAIAPTLLSMGWARHIVESKVNDKIRGRLEINDWSLGWFTGTKVGPVDLNDADGKPVLQLASLDTSLSISDVIRGRYDLGKVPVTGLRVFVTREANGTLNIQNLLPAKQPSRPAPPSAQPPQPSQPTPAPSQPAPPSTPAQPSKLPNISADLELSDCQAVYTDAASGESVTFPITGSLKIPDINQPITNSLQVAIQQNGVTDGAISLDGTVAAIHNNQVDADQPDVDETFKIAGLNLSAFQPVLASAFSKIAGHGDGSFSVKLTPHQPGKLNGGLTIAQIEATGKATKGDTFSADSLVIACDNDLPTADGLNSLATSSGRLKANNSIVLQQGASKSTVSFTADAAVSALEQLAKNQAPGSDGKIAFAADIDLARIANQLPHLADLKKGMALDTAQLTASAAVTMTNSDATPSASVDIDKVAGKNADKAFSLKPIDFKASVSDLGGGGAIPKLANLSATLTSAFATGTLTAPAPSQINGQLTAKLEDMQAELGQIIDFGSSTFSGSITGNLSSQLDLAEGDAKNGSDKVNGTLTATETKITRGKSPPIDIPGINYTLAAMVYRTQSTSIAKITGLTLNGTVGPADRPAVATNFSTDLTFGANSSIVASNVNVSNSINVPELRKELGTVATDKIPDDYTIKLLLGATAAMSKAGFSLDMPSFAITDNHGLINAGLAAGKGIRFATGASRNNIAPTGTVTISADLAGLEALVTGSEKTNKATLKAGHLDGVLALSGDANQMQVQEDYRASGLAVRAGKRTTPLAPVEIKSTAVLGPGDALTVSDFSAQGAGSEIHLKSPLVFEKAASATTINAELVGGGDVAQAMQFVNAFKPSPLPTVYTGVYTLDEAVATADSVITAKGSVQGNFTIQNPGSTTFSEPNFSLVDDLSYDQPNDSATLNTLTLDMHGSGALRLVARGTVADLTKTRAMQGVSADLHYDAAGLWKLIYATMTPAQQKSYADVKVTGMVDRHFLVAGSYPADAPFNVAVQSITVQGGIAIATFDGLGMSIANLDCPIQLKGGQFFIAEPTPASINDGTLSINGVAVDLGDPHQRLSIPAGTALMKNVSLNAVFVKNAAGWINNPLFVGEDKAAGVLNVTVDRCDRLPTDDLMKATTADNDGTFHMHMTLGRVQLGAPMLADVSKAIGPLLGGSFKVPSLQGEIPNYTLDLAKGIMTTDMTMDLSDKKRPMHLSGTVALLTEKLDMLLDIPTGLFGGDNGPIAQIAGDQLSIPITGTTSHPKFDVKSLFKGGGSNPGNALKNLFKGSGS